MKRKQWLLLLVLIIAALALSGCGVSQEGADVATTDPEGPWQTFVVWPLANALIWLDNLLANVGFRYHWGWAIIVFTVIIKIITFPLTLSQLRGMQAQRELQPKIQELQKKFGKDREKLSQAQMKLYQEAGVNPLSGCLPLIVQMPILFGLYSALVALGPNLTDAEFFWIPDLGFPSYSTGLSWIPETFQAGEYLFLASYLVLPILLVVTQFAMQRWMTPPTAGDGQAAGMTKQISLMMTFMFGFFTLQVPAGLTLYWVTSNSLQMAQQWVVTSDRFNLTKSKKSVAAIGDSSTEVAAIDVEGEIVESTVADTSESTASKPKRKRRKAKRR